MKNYQFLQNKLYFCKILSKIIKRKLKKNKMKLINYKRIIKNRMKTKLNNLKLN